MSAACLLAWPLDLPAGWGVVVAEEAGGPGQPQLAAGGDHHQGGGVQEHGLACRRGEAGD